jgi:hypothetical protein
MTQRVNLQDMLHSNPAVCLRFRAPRHITREAPFYWPACDGVGNSRGRSHGKYSSSLCVHSLRPHLFGGEIQVLFSSDAYVTDCFPKHQGEVGALLNLSRVLAGFSVAYFQVPWATKHGALQTFGYEAAYVVFPDLSMHII